MHCSLHELQLVISGSQMINGTSVDITDVSTDSRKIKPGDLFVALRGDQFDAHDFLPQIAQTGAVAVVAQYLPEGFSLPALLVPDTKQALADIARYWRQQFTLPVIGVTGSNGKTTVKEMIAAILAAAFGAGNRLSTAGNLNNEIGVPLTILGLTAAHQAAVIEMGMNHPGEIALLASVALPTVVLVNNAQREHQEFMQTVQAVAEENGAALLALPDDGVAVFPADDEYSDLWRSYAQRTGQRKLISFGLTPDADVSGHYQAGAFGSELTIVLSGQTFTVNLQAAGQHNVLNALAAVACCSSIGISNQKIIEGLQNFNPVSGRLQRKQAPNGALVIDDTYNANPDSVRAAIDVLAQLGRDQILVLGDMGEVGDNGPEFHREIGRYAVERGITKIFLMGELVRHTADAYGKTARYYTDLPLLLAELDTQVQSDTTVLVKGSRFMKMERVVAHLLSPEHSSGLTNISSQQKTKGTH
ncbi:UDP-N-acetylmuramoyl-tripeptide--D-alanyl-D-alanine ligase [Undibacterium sp. SXout7W]|uniref:UDP-N-acetylmuramoyl-tripeptide--D-alanyl-D- alanine ligase n=1 Tax=Undibacterium sp. SXout7W TaxID=3413049 RepID=UPI003BF05455